MLILYAEVQETKHSALLQHNMHLFLRDHRNKLLRYRRWQDIQLSLLGKLLLKEGMRYFNKEVNLKELYYTKYAKPYLIGSFPGFNISHSGSLAVVVISDQNPEIGVDIEKKHSIKIEDFIGQMTRNEQETIFNSENPLDQFFIYWTQKEAVLKAHGKGLSIPLRSFEVNEDQALIDDVMFYTTEIMLRNEYSCHVASTQRIENRELIVKEIYIDRFIRK